jgi:hypothetical protein
MTSNFQKRQNLTNIQAAAMSPKTPKTPKSLLLTKTPLSARYHVFRSVDREGGGDGRLISGIHTCICILLIYTDIDILLMCVCL